MNVVVFSAAVEPDPLNINVGDPGTIAVTIGPDAGPAPLTYSTTDPTIATVTPGPPINGVVTLTVHQVGAGTTTVQVLLNGHPVTTGTIHVNQPPVAAGQNLTTRENTAATVTLTATDPEHDPLTYSVVSGPAHGALSGTAPNLTYTPANGYHGADEVVFKANDGRADSAAATVHITVTPANTPPVAANQTVTTNEDTPKAITLAATDADNDALTYSIVTAPAHGTLAGDAPDVTYTPAAGYHGPDSFVFKANDGTADSNLATVTITVTRVNHAPLAVDDAYTTPFQTVLAVTLPGVLANDTDPDDDALTAHVITAPAHGQLALNGDGSFTYTPDAAFRGADNFTYAANDGALDSAPATVALTVKPPTATIDRLQYSLAPPGRM